MKQKSSLSTQILVVGGGITGLGIAWEASLRGLKVVLVEMHDIGQGTTGRYHGVLHSGGRYVISDPQSAHECAEENKILRNIVPHTIEESGGLFVATPSDPIEYPDRWFRACQQLALPVEELSIAETLALEPALNPRISRAFKVEDASLDSFDLSHTLVQAIQDYGGQVWLHHQLVSIRLNSSRMNEVDILNILTNEVITVGAEVVINASGPYAGHTARIAGIDLPIVLGKGTLVAMPIRHTNSIVNRCRHPDDGDIIVPVGTVEVLGTTDVSVVEPDDVRVDPWEVDLLIAEGEILVPGISRARPLRAWAGIRPLYKPEEDDGKTRVLSRAHHVINHKEQDGVDGFVSVFGGKLTTFRLMAEETIDLVSELLVIDTESRSKSCVLDPANTAFYSLPGRLDELEAPAMPIPRKNILCECELITFDRIDQSIQNARRPHLDDIRRDLRLGMGPCQGTFCIYRAAARLASSREDAPADGGILEFLLERWKGLQPLTWHHNMRQLEYMRRMYLELFCLDSTDEGSP